MNLEKIKEAIALLNSMVLCGESHTELSKRIVKEAFEELKKRT